MNELMNTPTAPDNNFPQASSKLQELMKCRADLEKLHISR